MTIKSIQRGTIDLSSVDYATATITAVTTSKSRIKFLGSVGPAAGTVNDQTCWVYLLNSTTVAAQRYRDGATLAKVSYEVIEHY